eukprot:501859-Pelagomonas_calceolata.AAC.4
MNSAREAQPAPPCSCTSLAPLTPAHIFKVLEHIDAKFQNSYGIVEDICMQNVVRVECTVKPVGITVPNSLSTQISTVPNDTMFP